MVLKRSGSSGTRFSNGHWYGITSKKPQSSRRPALTSLGATRLADVAEGVEFADPDGNEFRIIGAGA